MNPERAEQVPNAFLFPEGAYHEIRHGLHEPTMAFDGGDWGRDVLDPWIAAHRPIVAALHEAGRPEMASVALEAEDRWALYAFSHLIDELILPLQPPSIDPEYPADWLPPQIYRQFIAAIGGTVPDAGAFHPFHHEIVAVGPAAEWWPGCMVGSLLLARAGVTVAAGAEHLDPVVATTSCMYWASRRRHRDAVDLSHGWGSNSRWRTSFRRDYLLPDRYAYNVDAALRPASDGPPDDLPADAIDLLRHRCSTTTDHGNDVWIWDTHHEEPRPD